MKAVIILANIDKINKNDLVDSYIIGADKGAYNAIKQGIELNCAIGDFDSCNNDEYKLICDSCSNIIKLNSIKDTTDTNEAISLCHDYDEILILGGIKGKRIEHFYANIIDIKNNPKLSMKDDNSYIKTYDKSFIPENYKFMSLFAIDDSLISIKNCKYELNDYLLKTNDPLGVSNEVFENPYVDIKYGRLLVIYSNND